MSGFRSSVKRAVQATGDDFSVFQHPSLVDNLALTTERVALQWAPLRFVKIANKVSAAGEFPNEGSVTIVSGSGTSVTVSGAFPFGSAVGLVLFLLDAANAANKWQPFRIIGHSSNTLTLNRALPAALSASDPYMLLIDCEGFNILTVKGEFSTSGADADIIPILFDSGRTPNEPTASGRKPIRFCDRILGMDNLAFQGDTEEAAYYHAEAQSVSCIGALGAKVRLHSISGGNVSLWAATA